MTARKKKGPVAQEDTVAGLSARMMQQLADLREKAQLAEQFKIDLSTTPNPIPKQSSVLNATQDQYAVAAGGKWAISPDPYNYSATSVVAQTVDPATLIRQIKQAKASMMYSGGPTAISRSVGKIPDMFSGDLLFLSNDYASEFEVPWLRCYDDQDDETPAWARSATHAYQASKSLDWATQQWLLTMRSPDEARTRGTSNATMLQPGWDSGLRVRYMMKILNLKFTPGTMLGDLLVDTGDMYLRNTNEYHDQFWGSCMCTVHYGERGANMLGELLMVRRETLRLMKEQK